MTTDNDRALDTAAPDADEEAGGRMGTLINIGLSAFMIVFAIGCGLLGWFG